MKKAGKPCPFYSILQHTPAQTLRLVFRHHQKERLLVRTPQH
eukprot:XP_001706790.1 Hypothetical protein GL50803_5174 [Giardia lamblia ATCC 50803]